MFSVVSSTLILSQMLVNTLFAVSLNMEGNTCLKYKIVQSMNIIHSTKAFCIFCRNTWAFYFLLANLAGLLSDGNAYASF